MGWMNKRALDAIFAIYCRDQMTSGLTKPFTNPLGFFGREWTSGWFLAFLIGFFLFEIRDGFVKTTFGQIHMTSYN